MRTILESKQDCTGDVDPSEGAARFVMPAEICELDSFAAPERSWTANTVSLSRSKLVVMSRRMTFVGRDVVVSIKLASGSIAALPGKVAECEYHGRSLHRIVIALVKAEAQEDTRC